MRAFVLSLVVVHAATAFAVDRSIGAVKLLLTRSSSGREKLSFTSKDVNFMFPVIGGADDPSLAGVTIHLVTPNEPLVTLTVAPGIGNPGWKVVDRDRDTYSYKNSAAPQVSAVRALSFREARGIKLVAKEIGLALTAAQGSVGIRITTGSSRRCALFDAPTILQDAPNRFIAKGAIPTGGDCSDAALGAPPSTTSTTLPGCGNGVREGSEQCDGTDGLEDIPPGVECDGACQFCGTSTCRFPGPIDIPCCNGTMCIILGPHGGVCATTMTTTSSTSTTLASGCGNGALEPGEHCDGASRDSSFVCSVTDGCIAPGSGGECNCCATTTCYEGGISTPVYCCPGLQCAFYPPQPGVGFGLGECASTCAPYGTSCAPGLPCCSGTCQPLPGNPSVPPYWFCQ